MSPPRFSDVLAAENSNLPEGDKSVISISAKRQKKREVDRRCQRQARERTKARIAHLEKLVEDLQQQDAGGRIEVLMKQLAKVEKERDSLSHTLKEVHNAVSNHQTVASIEKGYSEALNLSSPVMSPRRRSISPPLIPEYSNSSRFIKSSMSLEPAPEKVEVHTDDVSQKQPHIPVYEPFSTFEAPSELEAIVPRASKACECSQDEHCQNQKSPGNVWRATNQILLERYKGKDRITPVEDYWSDDVAVRAILHGWENVEAAGGLSKSWAILRRVDGVILASVPPTERLTMLKTMHNLLQYHLEPTPARYAKLPSWYLQRPSQTMEHSYAINYIVWPGLRERLVFQQHRYCSNQFWRLFASCFKVQWAYDFRDCFNQRSDTGIYEISPLFHECIGDINFFNMTTDIFNQFPELRADVPASGSMPKPVSNVLQLQMANANINKPVTTNTRIDESTKKSSIALPVLGDLSQGRQWRIN